MKNLKFFLILAFAIVANSCATNKKMTNDGIFKTTWELEYISGPKIAFAGLYPDKKPTITFDKSTNKVEGNNSCNGYSADFTLKGTQLNFGEPGPSTMMYCGEGEQVFLNTIKKVNQYRIDSEGKLVLLTGDISMMRFKKFLLIFFFKR